MATLREECPSSVRHVGAAAIVNEIMTAGAHFAELQLHSGSQMTFGVVLPTYEPPDVDLEPDTKEGDVGGASGCRRPAAIGARWHTLCNIQGFVRSLAEVWSGFDDRCNRR